MSTYTQTLYQIVFSTKHREKTLDKSERSELFKSIWGIFPNFSGWQDGYAAFTYSIDAKDNLIEYIKNQEIHHQNKSFREELMELLNEHGVTFEEKYLD